MMLKRATLIERMLLHLGYAKCLNQFLKLR